MNTTLPATDREAQVIDQLWNAIRSVEAIERIAADIALLTTDQVNAQAEGIAGIAAIVVSHLRNQQIALGGSV